MTWPTRSPLAIGWYGPKISMQGVDAADGLIIVLIGQRLIKDRAPEVQLDAKDG